MLLHDVKKKLGGNSEGTRWPQHGWLCARKDKELLFYTGFGVQKLKHYPKSLIEQEAASCCKLSPALTILALEECEPSGNIIRSCFGPRHKLAGTEELG